MVFSSENPGLGGTVIGYYWGSCTNRSSCSQTNFQQIEIMFILMSYLFILFLYFILLCKNFDLSEPYRYILPLAIMGLMRADAGILFLGKLFSGNLM
jgi:hypothetical protein